MNELVCTLNDQNRVIMQQNSGLKTQVNDVATINRETDAKISELVVKNDGMSLKLAYMNEKIEDLVVKNAEMSSKLENMDEQFNNLSEENSQIKQMLNEVLDGIIELTTRP